MRLNGDEIADLPIAADNRSYANRRAGARLKVRLKPDPTGDRRWMQPHWAVEGIR